MANICAFDVSIWMLFSASSKKCLMVANGMILASMMMVVEWDDDNEWESSRE